MYDAIAPNVTVKIAPIDPQVTFRNPYTLIESYAGLLQAGLGDVGSEKDETPDGFAANDWNNQSAFQVVEGELEWVRFTPQGRLMRGIKAARDSHPERELCGLTVDLRTIRYWNRILEDVNEDLPPRMPKGVQVLHWKSKKGKWWETTVPTTADSVSLLRYRIAPANFAVQAATDLPLDKDQGFEMTLNCKGIADGHIGPPGLRVTWGGVLSVVFRGKNGKTFPQLESRQDGKWNVRMAMKEGTALTEEFWKTSHKLRIYRLAGKCIIELDGVGYYINMFKGIRDTAKAVSATWRKARVEVSILGADVLFGLAKLSGKEADGQPLQAGFQRSIRAPQRLGSGLMFKAQGARPCRVKGTISQMIGVQLDQITATGIYSAPGNISYSATLTCDATSAPILCCLAAYFPASADEPLPAAVDVREAVSQWEVDSGEPEDSQAAQATFTLSREMLKRVCARQHPPVPWQKVLAPFRAVTIAIQTSEEAAEETLFRGWIKPNSYEVVDSADQVFSVVCGDVISERLNEYAGLIDERFAPLDLALGPERSAIWGGDCVQFIIGVILGEEAASRFNGDGNALKYYSAGTPALLSIRDVGASLAILSDMPQKGFFYLAPPFGESAISWIQKLAEYDFGVVFYDPRTDGVYYGDIHEFYGERGLVVHSADGVTITKLSNQGEFERSYNDIRVWGRAPTEGAEAILPSLIMGRAGDDGTFSLDPTSRAQSWTRSKLLKPELLQDSFLNSSWLQATAYVTWLEVQGAAPEKFTVEFDSGFPGIRWGEMLKFAAPGDVYANFDELPNRRITKVVHRGDLSGGKQTRFSTTIEARSISNSGQ